MCVGRAVSYSSYFILPADKITFSRLIILHFHEQIRYNGTIEVLFPRGNHPAIGVLNEISASARRQ